MKATPLHETAFGFARHLLASDAESLCGVT